MQSYFFYTPQYLYLTKEADVDIVEINTVELGLFISCASFKKTKDLKRNEREIE